MWPAVPPAGDDDRQRAHRRPPALARARRGAGGGGRGGRAAALGQGQAQGPGEAALPLGAQQRRRLGLVAGEVGQEAAAEQGQGEGRPARGHQRQRDAGDGQEPDHVTDVDGRLGDEPDRQRRRHHADPRVGVAGGDPQADVGQRREQPDDRDRAEEPQLLADDREDEVVVGVRQVAPLRPALPEARPEDPAVGEGVQGLAGLVGRTERVGVRGVEERGDPALAVGGDDAERDRADHARGRQQGHQPGRGAAEPQQGHDHDQQRDRRAEVRLEHDEREDQQRHRDERQQGLAPPARAAAVAYQDVRPPQGERDLGELGGLEGHPGDAEPAARAVDQRADTRHEDEGEEHEAEPEQERARRPQAPRVHPQPDPEQDDPEEREGELAEEHAVGRAARGVGVDRRRRQHHHQPEGGEQAEHAEDEVQGGQRAGEPGAQRGARPGRRRAGRAGARTRRAGAVRPARGRAAHSGPAPGPVAPATARAAAANASPRAA